MTSNSLPIPNERILEETRLKIAIARQHLDALAKFGLTADWLNQLEAAANETETIATYTKQRGEQQSFTAAKDEILAKCVQWGRDLRLRMDLAETDKTATGRPFPIKKWRDSGKSENKMIVLLPELIELAQEQAQVLAQFGQTPEDITTAQTLYTQLKAANEAQEEYKFMRTLTTAERQEIYRKLYDGVNRINQIGQAVYGANTPNGQLFRSNWGLGKRTKTDKPEEMPS